MDYLVSKGYTQRLACRVVGLSRSSYCRRRAMANQPSQPDKYAALRVWLVKFADEHHRWGYRRAWQCARAEGWNVGRETVRRLWRAENLRVQPRRKGKRLKATISPDQQVKADHPGHVWALDFQFDSDWRGKTFKICNIVDEFTREHVRFALGRALTAKDVIELLDAAVLERGCPEVLRMDNGPEFISHALEGWSAEVGAVRAFIPPGQPWRNGYVESFHNRMRDELLEENLFDGIEDACLAVESWSYRYNNFHPHSSLGYRSPAQFAASQKVAISA